MFRLPVFVVYGLFPPAPLYRGSCLYLFRIPQYVCFFNIPPRLFCKSMFLGQAQDLVSVASPFNTQNFHHRITLCPRKPPRSTSTASMAHQKWKNRDTGTQHQKEIRGIDCNRSKKNCLFLVHFLPTFLISFNLHSSGPYQRNPMGRKTPQRPSVVHIPHQHTEEEYGQPRAPKAHKGYPPT